jgi:hypothetical protein
MPESRHPRGQTREQWLRRTENARREARFRFARERIGKIVAGVPPLTAEQRAELARLLTPGDAA